MSAPRHVRRLLDLDAPALRALVDRAAQLKAGAAPRRFDDKLLGLLFEKPSTRTRLSFEAAAFRLGAGFTFISARDSQLGRGEPVRDTAAVLGRYVDAVALRTFRQQSIDEAAAHAGVPVINALSDQYHPCQTVADLLTVQETLGRLDGAVVTYLGDGNNVFASLAEAAARVDFALRFAGPAGYRPDADLLAEVAELGGDVALYEDPVAACRGAHVLYTDVGTSMGQETEAARRRKVLAPYQLNAQLTSVAPNAVVMHCLPAHRGEEVTAEVIDGPQSRIYEQAENRMWAQMAILESLWSESD